MYAKNCLKQGVKPSINMEYTINKQERYIVFALKEENLNSLIAPSLKAEFAVLHNQGTKNFILDLQAVKYADSSGLSAILAGNRFWSIKGQSSFILTGLNPAVKLLLQIARLTDILTVLPTVSEAVDYVMMEELERELGAKES